MSDEENNGLDKTGKAKEWKIESIEFTRKRAANVADINKAKTIEINDLNNPNHRGIIESIKNLFVDPFYFHYIQLSDTNFEGYENNDRDHKAVTVGKRKRKVWMGITTIKDKNRKEHDECHMTIDETKLLIKNLLEIVDNIETINDGDENDHING